MNFTPEHKVVRIAFHLAFWVISYFILLQIFRFGDQAEKVDHIYTILFHIFLIPAVYINLNVFIPRIIQSGKKNLKWPFYTICCTIIILLFSWLNTRFFNSWSAGIFPDYYFISYFSIWEVARIFFIYIVLTTLIKLSRSWFIVNELKRQLLKTEKEKADIELQVLKSQINPHFFFNTLNGLYGMSLRKDDILPDSILRLSELMRYLIYESRSNTVALDKEISILENYLELMKIRTDKNAEITIEKKGDPENLAISPLLLIPFLENAFKHGLKSGTGNDFIRMGIFIDEALLTFSVANNKGLIDPAVKDKDGGVGLENVRRRLELIYPGKHQLNVKETDSEYQVTLQIQLHA